jgi:hypothetical protein
VEKVQSSPKLFWATWCLIIGVHIVLGELVAGLAALGALVTPKEAAAQKLWDLQEGHQHASTLLAVSCTEISTVGSLATESSSPRL